MPSLRDLKKRLRSVRTTGQLAGAMRTVSTAKYSRVNSMLTGYNEYAAALHELTEEVAAASPQAARSPEGASSAPVYVLLAGNRGLCGGYNHELFSFFDERVLNASPVPPVVIAAGRTAIEHCRERGVKVHAEFEVSDVPQFGEAESLAGLLEAACAEYRADGARFVYQRFINMMKHVPDIAEYYPRTAGDAPEQCGGEHEASAFLFIPDEASVREKLLPLGCTSTLYDLLLQCALGSHAATLMAMRSAYENAQESALMLETAINRRRQSEVTQGVLETASDSNNYL